MLREKMVKAGDWRTLEWFWNATATASFLLPAGAVIKVRYGIGWFGKDRQKQTLDGQNVKVLRVGRWSVTRARMQVKVKDDVQIAYDVTPGGLPVSVSVEFLSRVERN